MICEKMLKPGSPNNLWYDCFKLEAFIRSNTAHDIFMTNDEVQETIISGETWNISRFYELEFL